MFNVGLYGVENSHAGNFCAAFTEDPVLSDFRPAFVGGIYPDTVSALSEKYGAEIENDPERMAEKADCGMITCRDGKYHLAAALPFIRRKKPIFLDKPLTVSTEDVEILSRELKGSGQTLIGGSSVKLSPQAEEAKAFIEGKTLLSGSLTCPISLDNPYGGFSFYASHLIETLLFVFGYGPDAVEMHRMAGGLYGTVFYGELPVRFTFLDGVYDYVIEVDTKEGVLQRTLNIDDIHLREAEAFSRFVKTGETDFTFEELASSVYLMDAMLRALDCGKRVSVSFPEEVLK